MIKVLAASVVLISNLDTGPIFCGWDSKVTSETGLPVPMLGQVVLNLSHPVEIWCVTETNERANFSVERAEVTP